MVLLALLVLFVVLPIIELVVLVRVAGQVGILETVALLVLIGAFGWWLCKLQGLGVLRRIQDTVARGEQPGRELADGGLIAAAGIFLLLPGFVSDIAALLLLLPPTRAVIRGALGALAVRRLGSRLVRTPSGRSFVDVEVLDVRPSSPQSSSSSSGTARSPRELDRP